MAAITIRGIRIKCLNITPAADALAGDEKITGTYQLISSADKVLAEQGIGNYGNSLKFPASPTTQKALDAFLTAYKADVEAVLGLDATT